MSIKNNILEINNYLLTIENGIEPIRSQLESLKKTNTLIHIASFLEDTEFIKQLKENLSILFKKSKIIFLTGLNKDEISLTIFTLDKNVNMDFISNEILYELHLDTKHKNTSIEEYRNQLFNRYFIDNLTNLPNLYQLRKDLEDNEESGLILLNIDNFQTINNFYGFLVGDYVIEQIGIYLKKHIPNHIIYKLTGDEFALMLKKNMGFYDLKEHLTQLYKVVDNIMIQYKEIKIFIEVTLGSSSNKDLRDVFSKVSMALKYAKEMSFPFWIYENRMNFENEYERNLKLSCVVRTAVEKSQIIPYYQAIIDNQTSEIIKYECLARLVDENQKILLPNIFIPISKKIRVYNLVTKIIIEKSFQKFENNNIRFSINISIEDIMSSSMFNFIIEKLKTSKASNRVTFELLESEAIQDFRKVERFISEVKRYGAKIAIDDFGSGYSNFSYLIQMNTNYIKIDGSLIMNIDVDKTAYIVVETIVDFAKKLGIKTIAEYVHSNLVLDKVKTLGIDYSQGYYIHEPTEKIS